MDFFFKVNKTRKEELKDSKKFNPQLLQHLGKLFSVQLNVVSVEERQKRRMLKRKARPLWDWGEVQVLQ